MADDQTELLDHLATTLLGKPFAQLTEAQGDVIQAICAESPTLAGPRGEAVNTDGFWERLADRVAAIGGSWTFIGAFGLVLVLWVGGNTLILGPLKVAFDPYPFIFLNLVLSMLAAIQAPIIMMSQNRAAAKDRMAADHDYRVNLRAELEIMRLHDKLDSLRTEQVESLIRSQSEALELLRAQIAELRPRA